MAFVGLIKAHPIPLVRNITEINSFGLTVVLDKAWYQEKGAGVQSGGIAGRSFYTSLGHLDEIWQVSD